MVTSRLGSPVLGADFYDRDDERRQLWDDLHRDHVLLLAPRRVGKTSLMFRLRDEAAERNLAAVYSSAAEVQDELGFLETLCRNVARTEAGAAAVRSLTKGPTRKFFKKIKKVGLHAAGFGADLELDTEVGQEWPRLGDALDQALRSQPKRWLVLIDELPLFVLALLRQDPTSVRARRFLTWLRNLRQTPDEPGKVRWLFAGSIGLDTVAERFNLGDTINDLHLRSLGPFSPEVADRFLAELGATYELPLAPEVRQRIAERVGWLIPYHLQALFATLRDGWKPDDPPPTVAVVDQAVEELLDPAHKAYFDTWRQRLTEELGRPDDGHALAVLAAAAADPTGATRETLSQNLAGQISDPGERAEKLRFLLNVLVGDGYLVEDAQRYRFRSPLLREYWIRRVLP